MYPSFPTPRVSKKPCEKSKEKASKEQKSCKQNEALVLIRASNTFFTGLLAHITFVPLLLLDLS
jgi:hypothetical protein